MLNTQLLHLKFIPAPFWLFFGHESWDRWGHKGYICWILRSRREGQHSKESLKWDGTSHSTVTQLVFKYSLRGMQPPGHSLCFLCDGDVILQPLPIVT